MNMLAKIGFGTLSVARRVFPSSLAGSNRYICRFADSNLCGMKLELFNRCLFLEIVCGQKEITWKEYVQILTACEPLVIDVRDDSELQDTGWLKEAFNLPGRRRYLLLTTLQLKT